MDKKDVSLHPAEKFPGVLTVTQLNEYVKRMIESAPSLVHVYIKGEISNFKNHYSTGHYYFTIKDENSQLRAVMFRSAASKMTFMPEDGMKITAHGRISAFVRDGTYQLYCDGMEPDGVGALYIAFEQLKKKLEREGLFDPARKRPLPKIPTRVGIITSPTGAAVRDIINVCGRRFPCAKLVLYPALVQGPEAPPQLVSGLQYFNRTNSVDVILLGRGGGSIEDLWAFNDESVARAVAASHIPVISAVGHETDFTICDFAADRRAPTPSAAAELAVPDTEELKRKISHIITRESDVIRSLLRFRREQLQTLTESRAMTDPETAINERRMTTDQLYERLVRAAGTHVQGKKAELAGEAGKLNALNPLAVLSRGYSAVYQESGALVKTIDDVTAGDHLVLQTIGGEASCTVDAVRKQEQKTDRE